MQEETENFDFVQGVICEIFDSLKTNATKYLVFFDDSCEKISASNTFADDVAARRHRGLSTSYIKHNLFHKKKHGRELELQTSLIVFFKSLRDVMQVSTLSAQLGLGSELVDWFRDSTSVLYGDLLIDLSPRADDRLSFCTNTGSIPSKFFLSQTDWNNQIFWTLNSQSLSTLQVFQSFSHKCKSHFLKSCPKEFIRFLCESIVNFLRGKLHSIKRHHKTKFRREGRLFSLKAITWKQRRDVLASEEGSQFIKIITPHVIDHFSWYGIVCSCVQREFEYRVSYPSKVSTFPK